MIPAHLLYLYIVFLIHGSNTFSLPVFLLPSEEGTKIIALLIAGTVQVQASTGALIEMDSPAADLFFLDYLCVNYAKIMCFMGYSLAYVIVYLYSGDYENRQDIARTR